MAENKHSRVTESEKKRHKKAVKRNRFLAKLGIGLLIVAVIAFGANKYISGMYNSGETIDEDIRTAEDVKHGFVGINQLFRRFRFINEEPAGHMSADFLHNRKGILCQIKMLPCHNASVDCRQSRVSFPFGLL